MKAHEFDKGAPVARAKTTSVNVKAESAASTPHVPPVLQESTKQPKKVKSAPSPVAPHTHHVFGVDDPHGHVIRRIAHAKPEIWAKIQNWD
jgi:hypothetical protein